MFLIGCVIFDTEEPQKGLVVSNQKLMENGCKCFYNNLCELFHLLCSFVLKGRNEIDSRYFFIENRACKSMRGGMSSYEERSYAS